MSSLKIEDIYEWADGIKSAAGTPDLASKISDEEAIIAGIIIALKSEIEESKKMYHLEFDSPKMLFDSIDQKQ